MNDHWQVEGKSAKQYPLLSEGQEQNNKTTYYTIMPLKEPNVLCAKFMMTL